MYCSEMPKVKNQHQTNACFYFALASLKEAQEYKERGIWKEYSPTFLFGLRDDNHYHGEGANAKQALTVLKRYGICEQSDFNFLGTFEETEKKLGPHLKRLLPESIPNSIKSFRPLNDIEQVKASIKANTGVIISIMYYNSFGNIGNDGVVKQVKDDDKYLTNHGMVVFGFNDVGWIVQNSYGELWGNDGRCVIPYDYKGIIEFWEVEDRPYTAFDDIAIYVNLDKKEVLKITNDTKTEKFQMDYRPEIINNNMYVHMKSLARIMGYSLEYKENIRTAVFKKEGGK